MSARRICFHYILKDQSGKVLDSSHGGEPMDFIEGKDQIIPGLELALKPLKAGDKKNIAVKAEQAYGVRDERLVMEVPLADLPQSGSVKVGMAYDIEVSDNASHVFHVTKLSPSSATLDGNHPLAGQDLFFEVAVSEARAATAEELAAADAEEEACCDHDHDHDHGHSHSHDEDEDGDDDDDDEPNGRVH